MLNQIYNDRGKAIASDVITNILKAIFPEEGNTGCQLPPTSLLGSINYEG
jgi:hypothetical protein